MSWSPAFDSEYDLIFAGGGTAAGVIAGRLAAAAPDLRILILEAGPVTRNLLSFTQPGPDRVFEHLAPDSTTVRLHASKPSTAVGGREIVVPSAQCVGGGSSIGFSMYMRASKSDYDDWETGYKNPGWGSADLIPLLKKSETYQVQPNLPTHGYSGPLKVSYGGIFTSIGQHFLAAAQAFDKERQVATDGADPNDLTSVNLYAVRLLPWISAESGTRSDVPHNYIYPRELNSKLTVIPAAQVKRVIFDQNNRASGVEFVWNRQLLADADRSVHTVKATRLIVVSAGAFGSPGILERSGIGSPKVLAKVGVETRVDLPGVGEGYQDHNAVYLGYKTADEANTHDHIVRKDAEAVSFAHNEWSTTGKGLLAHNSIDFACKVRPTSAELDQFGPSFRSRWDSYFAGKPDKPVVFLEAVNMLVSDEAALPPGKYFSMGYMNLYPIARGYVHIRDKDDVAAPTDFSAGFLESAVDVAPLVWAYKHTREIARRLPLFRGEYAPLHPKFAPNSSASIIDDVKGPVPPNAPRIVYSAADDAEIERYTRQTVRTLWHSLGTCPMKPRQDGGVVDPALNVYGVKGLKVADISICPANIGSNTYSTALVVGEKAALIIAEELGVVGV
ncbi:alcohol oxidase-like protein [Artomyces pyxidatus]|uniref:Alcohol oxidase-like protein n=1 Tax=Artomyces pyxidatus TaxID=48021 RepID=A0ACB8TDE3_9AGAM|nr:alcohol oxidase-like protein [Artomyces pyxidatus]